MMNKFLILPLLGVSILGAKFSNGQNWTSIPTPVATNLILFDIVFPDGQDAIGYAGGSSLTYNGDGTILKTVDQGATWSIVWSSAVNATGVTALHFHNADTGYAGTQGGALMRTIDGGVNWTSADFDLVNDQGEVSDLEFYDSSNGVLLTQWNGVYITTDGGDTWVPATTGPGTGQLALCYADANTLFACGNDQSIFKSTDGGATWTSSYQGVFQIVNLGIDFLDVNNGMVTSEEGQYFKTSDGGANWTPGTIPNQFGLMRGVVMLDLNNIFVCATPGQVFRTIDSGANWTDDSGVNPNPSYYAITFTPDGTGFVSGSGSTGGTILRRTPITLGAEDRRLAGPSLNAYPNPVSGQLTVEFNSAPGERMDLSVVNGLGQAVLTQRIMSNRGVMTRVSLDLSGFAQGMYRIELSDDGGVIGSTHISVASR